MKTTVENTAIHAVLSNPDKVAIMDHLARVARPESVNDISSAIGRSQTWTSKCLRSLESVGLIVRESEPTSNGRIIRSRIAPSAIWPIQIWR